MRLRLVLGAGSIALLAIPGCFEEPPYVVLAGYVNPPRLATHPSLHGAALDVFSLEGDLGRPSAALAASWSANPALLTYEVRLAAGSLPSTPALFKVALRNPEQPPRDGYLLAGLTRLARPAGRGPDLGTVRVDLDATSSVTALALEYRHSLDPDEDLSGVDLDKVARHLQETPLAAAFLRRYGEFVFRQTNEAPAGSGSGDLARQASEELPPDLGAL